MQGHTFLPSSRMEVHTFTIKIISQNSRNVRMRKEWDWHQPLLYDISVALSSLSEPQVTFHTNLVDRVVCLLIGQILLAQISF